MAVVYAVMVETGLNRHDLGKLILAACFITDLGTVLALGGLFASYGWLLIVFIAVSAVTVLLLPRLIRFTIARFGHRVSEPEIKLLLVVLLALGGLATQAGSEAACPPMSPGWWWPGCPARPGADGPAALHRLRLAHPLLLPACRDAHLYAGSRHQRRGDRAPAASQARGEEDRRLANRRPFKLPTRERTYTTLLMATGLAFGSIAALYGHTHGLIGRAQYTELVTVVILSAFVPTLIAQQFFRPALVDAEEEEALGAEDLSIVHHRPGPRAGAG